MDDKKDHLITRKKFLKISFTALLGAGVFGKMSPLLATPRKNQARQKPEYRLLGRTGIKVTSVGFGTARTMEPSLVQKVLDTGINFFDTGRYYSGGQNEVMLGKVLKGVRQEVIIQSKMLFRPFGWSEALDTPEMGKKLHTMMETYLEQSLKALQTDYIDIMLLHGVSETQLINHETVMRFFAGAKKEGKIRACGFSTHWNQVELTRDANRSKFYDVVMVPYNHKGSFIHSGWGFSGEWDQSAMEKEFEEAQKNGIGVVAIKTCSGGPYSPDGVSKATFKDALKWVLSHSYISTMAVAMGNIKEINENIRAMF